MARLRVAVVYGGPSREHDISVLSGESILEHIDKTVYDVEGILISQDGQWMIGQKPVTLTDAVEHLRAHFDFVLLGLHGTFGEDGTLQSYLEEAGIPFSGSHSHASRVAMDKHETSRLYIDAGFSVPKEVVLMAGYETKLSNELDEFEFPVIVKPVSQGSSFGISKAENRSKLEEAIIVALKEDSRVIVQEYIKGQEVSAGVIENELGELTALPPTELIPLMSDIFDYDSKYTPGGAKEITPAETDELTIRRIQKLAVSAHRVIGCSGYSRTDMILRCDTLYMIETNTLPGMTNLSILPQQAKASGIPFTKLIDLIIQAGLRNSGYN